MTMAPLTPEEARRAIASGALLVDIREADEYARESIPGAINLPLARLDALPASPAGYVFHCRSGMRTTANATRLAAAAGQVPCRQLAGGIDAWRAARLPTARDPRRPLEVMRQVQLAAGGLVVLGVVLGLFASPGFFVLTGFVGLGLMTAGATGWCGMARLLQRMPWNRPSAAA